MAKRTKSELLQHLLDGAYDGVTAMRAGLAYEGTNKDYDKKAKQGYSIAHLFQKTLGTLNAMDANQLAHEKFAARGGAPANAASGQRAIQG